jgi:hypothetical protein
MSRQAQNKIRQKHLVGLVLLLALALPLVASCAVDPIPEYIEGTIPQVSKEAGGQGFETGVGLAWSGACAWGHGEQNAP